MITKLCDSIDRSEFLLRILCDMLKTYPEQQIMILAQNKSLLKYLYDAITTRHIATTGYYVGGMKEAALKETEGKQVVLATYSMASEALDIKTLASLIMATPRTDITQSVGRILRMKHKHPVIVDVIDVHDCFKNQWYKRRLFYKKQKYTVMRANNNEYNGIGDGSHWRVDFAGFKACTEEGGSDEEDRRASDPAGRKGFGKCMLSMNDV